MRVPPAVRRFAWPLALSALLVLGAILPASAVRDAISGRPVAGARLVRPALYVAMAPLSDTLDAMSLLSVPQLIAFTVSLIAVFVAWRLWPRRRHPVDAWGEFCAALRAFLLYVLLVLLAAVLPRPMAALVMDDPDALLFDTHSHTNYSHDARATFTVEANREWHRAAGFHVAYITDHRCFDGAAEGMRANPKRAGDGTVLLSGIELPADQLHVIALEPPDAPVPGGLLEGWCLRAVAGRPLVFPPTLVQTIPENLNRMTPAAVVGDGGVNAIELSDGAPRGIAQAQRDHVRIVMNGALHGLTMLAGSNNHGWGRTAVAWNLMHVRGWRALSPDSVGALIQMRMRAERQHAVQVVARRSPDGAPAAMLVLTLPEVAANAVRVMSLGERLSWLLWIWGIVVAVEFRRRSRK